MNTFWVYNYKRYNGTRNRMYINTYIGITNNFSVSNSCGVLNNYKNVCVKYKAEIKTK